MKVRPTSDRLREALFGVLTPRIENAYFLDLCAGSGAIGIEALSRSAAHVTFVDLSRKSCGLIEANLDLCGIPESQTEVVLAEAGEFLRRRNHHGAEGWDIIFFDPPYNMNYIPVMERVGGPSATLLKENGLFIVEHHHKNQLIDKVGNISRFRLLKQGDSTLSFYHVE
jgi:16S rRNA (guanine966-N2)-methyltransferase